MSARRLVILIAFALAAPAAAQTDAPAAAAPPTTLVYKCKNTDGTVVYSERPCSPDPGKVETIDTSAALRTGSGGHQQEIAAGVADSECREQAYKSTHADEAQMAESNRHIADYEQQRQNLQASGYGTAATGQDNAPGLAEIDAAIAKEREYQQKAATANEAAYEDALRRCDEALQKSTQQPSPAAAPPPPEDSDQNGG